MEVIWYDYDEFLASNIMVGNRLQVGNFVAKA